VKRKQAVDVDDIQLAQPASLRDRAACLRWAAGTVEGPQRVHDLLVFADQLEARATELELLAKHPQDIAAD